MKFDRVDVSSLKLLEAVVLKYLRCEHYSYDSLCSEFDLGVTSKSTISRWRGALCKAKLVADSPLRAVLIPTREGVIIAASRSGEVREEISKLFIELRGNVLRDVV
jgi:hypothetical protein